MRRARVLLPGITVLIRLVATVREAAAERMHATLAAAAVATDPALPGRLLASLRLQPGVRFSEMESWRRPPTRVSGPGLVRPWTGRRISRDWEYGRWTARGCHPTGSRRWPATDWPARP